jgi:hypothetical protein
MEQIEPMDAKLPHYPSGRPVRVGDRVRYRENGYNVAFVSDGESGEFGPGYRDYLGYEPGIMIVDDDGRTVFLTEPGDELEFVHEAGVTLY